MLKYIFYFGFILLDIVFYFIITDSHFPKREEAFFSIITVSNRPIFLFSVLISFTLFKKTNYRGGCFVAAIPLIVVPFYYLVFR